MRCALALAFVPGVAALPGTAEAAVTTFDVTPWAFPAGRTASVQLAVDQPGAVDVAVVDHAGATVRHLAQGLFVAGGEELHWDGRDDAGAALPDGAYLVVASQ